MSETKTYRAYIVMSRTNVPVYPSMATNKKMAIKRFTGITHDDLARKKAWMDYQNAGYSVQVCELVVPVINRW